jgi:hypothetical protein
MRVANLQRFQFATRYRAIAGTAIILILSASPQVVKAADGDLDRTFGACSRTLGFVANDDRF